MNRLTLLVFLSFFNSMQGFVVIPNEVSVKRFHKEIAEYHRNFKLNGDNGDDNGDNEETENKFDIIEGIGGFMGYPKERKWKGVRIACYSIFAGSILRSAVVDLGNYIDNKMNKDAFDQYSNVATIIQERPSGSSFGKGQSVEFEKVKILDEPYLCDNIKFI